MGIKVGIVGSTGFASSFIPLYKAHPLVDEVVVAELVDEKREKVKKRFNIERTYNSLAELCKTDVDAIAIFTQRQLHAEHVLEALRAGKHVYCAVPVAHSIENIKKIIDEVTRTKLIYMSGETSYYYPCTLYCRDQYNKGKFGKVVYAEACYMHDMSHGFYEAFQESGGENWKQVAGFPPMYYPTHSVSMILSVTGARVTHVSCLGYRDEHEDGIFREGSNLWNNPFSNETAIMRTSDGAVIRINELRRVGWIGKDDNSVHMSMFGTLGSYEEQANGRVWTSLNKEDITDLNPLLTCGELDVSIREHDENTHEALLRDYYKDVSKVHDLSRLPKEFFGLTNGHGGSHQYLTDDFVRAVTENKLPPTNIWAAARYNVPGIIAHESALRNGEMLEVPDFGEPPTYWEHLYQHNSN